MQIGDAEEVAQCQYQLVLIVYDISGHYNI